MKHYDSPAALRFSENYPNLPDQRDICEHPTDPTKLVRWSEYVYEEKDCIFPFVTYLQELERVYGVPTVHPQFLLSSNPPEHVRLAGRYPDFIHIAAIVDRIDDAISFDEITIDDEKSYEYDNLTRRLIKQLSDVYENGGVFCGEIYRYDQFVYSDASERGKKLILTDVDPLTFSFLPSPDQRRRVGLPIEYIETLVSFVSSVVKLNNMSGNTIPSTENLKELIYSIKNCGVEQVEVIKSLLIQALELGDESLTYGIAENDDRLEEGVESILHGQLWKIDQCIRVADYLESGGDF